MALIKHVQGDRYPVITATLKDSNDADADKSDPDTWPVVDLSSNVDAVRVDYYQAKEQYDDITPSASADTLTKSGHKLDDDDRVRFSTSNTLPAGLSETTLYYVISTDQTAGTFQVSTSEGGSAVDITDAGTGQLNVIRQYDSASATLVGDGSGGQVTFTHPTLVWENAGDYELEYVVIFTSPAGKETVYERDQLELRSRSG
jgi:hypothetical protein